MRRTAMILGLTSWLLTSCSLPGALAQSSAPPDQSTPFEAPLNLPEAIVERARQDLAERLEIPQEEIETMEVTAVSWPNAALGCPEPGQVYAEVETAGYRILLQVQDEVYEFHTDEVGTFVLCAGGQPFE